MSRPLLLCAAFSLAGGCVCGPAGPPVPDAETILREPTAVGAPSGPGTSRLLDERGGTVSSADGRLTVTVPPGALAAATELSVQPISNHAPRGVGSAYRLSPEGTQFPNPVLLTFYLAEGDGPLSALGVLSQRESGYWIPVEDVRRDEAARTLTVATSHFSDWTIVLNPPPHGRDLFGTFSLDQSLELPFLASGSATLHFMGEDASDAVYLLTGTISLPASFAFGDETCVPDQQEKLLDDSVAEISKSKGEFHWGINALWHLSCTNSQSEVTTRLVFTIFDTLGINLYRCPRQYIGTPQVGQDRIEGSFEIDCAAEGTVASTWDFRSCTSLGNGAACGSSMTCHGGLCTASRTVTGARQVSYWPESGALPPEAPSDLGVSSVAAVSADGQGGWVSYPGTFDGVGNFTIPAVPAGPYQLALTDGAGLLWSTATSSSSVDLGFDVLGRSDLAYPTGSTQLTLEVSGLEPWSQVRDEVELLSANANLGHVAFLSAQLGTGVTGGSRGEDWFSPQGGAGPLGRLIASDTLFAHQLATRSVTVGPDTYYYAALATAGSLTGVTLADQTPATLSWSLGAQPQTGSVAVDWRRTQFEALQAGMSPDGTTDASAHSLRVEAVAHPLVSPAPVGATAPLVRVELPAGGDLDLGSLAYGQFLDPGLWRERLAVEFRVHVSYLAQGASIPLDVIASIGWKEVLATAPSPSAPTLGPAGAPLIEGLDAFVARTGVGTTPTLSWSAPSLGTPSHYEVHLYELFEQGGASVATRRGVFLTDATQVRFHAGVLTAGKSYFARLVARTAPGTFSTAPSRTSNTGAFAESLTATFSP